MRVRVVLSFAAHLNGETTAWHVGQEAELPPNVNWLALGWVVPVENQKADGGSQSAESEEPKPRRTRKVKNDG